MRLTCSNRIGPTRCEARVVCDVCSFHSVGPYQCRHEVFYTQSPTVCQSSARTENVNMYKVRAKYKTSFTQSLYSVINGNSEMAISATVSFAFFLLGQKPKTRAYDGNVKPLYTGSRLQLAI